MFALIGNSPNLYVWAITSYYKNNVTYNTIEHIVRFSNNYSQLVGKLSKGTITAYNSALNLCFKDTCNNWDNNNGNNYTIYCD